MGCSLVVFVFALQIGRSAIPAFGQPISPDDVVRNTKSGSIRGYLHTLTTGKQVERYLGVPYATPPLGSLRFEKPIPPAEWEGILRTTSLPPACVQESLEKAYILTHNPEFDGRMSEDCLYINIYVPRNTSQDRVGLLPVLVHVHGGSNVVGMGAMFHGDVLASMGNIIVININYRLGPFGFLFMPQLGLMGNYGLYDQNLAFKWVKDNIATFGGDPDRITIQGHSAGSVDVGHHVLSPLAAGLFRSAIMMSGSPTAYWAFTYESDAEDNDGRLKTNLEMLGCEGLDTDNTVVCLRKIPYEKLAITNISHKSRIFNFSPAIDGVYILDHPTEVLSRMASDADLRPSCDTIITGVTRDEGSLTAEVQVKNVLNIPVTSSSNVHLSPPEDMDVWESLPDEVFAEFSGFKDIAKYLYTPWKNESNATARIIEFSNFFGDNTFNAPAIKMADGFTGLKGSTAYAYRFNHISKNTEYPAWMGVPHGTDQFYLFGSPVEDQALRNYTNEDVEVSLKMMRLWARFVHDPKTVSMADGLPQLPKYTANEEYLEIANESGNGAFVEGKRRLRKIYTHFWNIVLPEVVSKQPSKNQGKDKDMKSEDKSETIIWITTALVCVFAVVSLVLLGCLIFNLRNKKGSPVKKHELMDDSENRNAT